MTDQEKYIEALAKIKRQLLWGRDNIKEIKNELEKLRAPNFPTGYFVGGLFTLGLLISEIKTFWMGALTVVAWPAVLGATVAEIINKFLEALK